MTAEHHVRNTDVATMIGDHRSVITQIMNAHEPMFGPIRADE